ncbi:hypothetical protein BDZ89DRAFT_457844 [Hymenopellis radicata]|nr:hypothetical protein BDZ89DRAFT_457844 [Hymenopellis radicata]
MADESQSDSQSTDVLSLPGSYGTQLSNESLATFLEHIYTQGREDSSEGGVLSLLHGIKGHLETTNRHLETVLGLSANAESSQISTTSDMTDDGLIETLVQLFAHKEYAVGYRAIRDHRISDTEDDEDDETPKPETSEAFNFLKTPADARTAVWINRRLDLFARVNAALSAARCGEAWADDELSKLLVEQERLRTRTQKCRQALEERKNRRKKLEQARVALRKHISQGRLG